MSVGGKMGANINLSKLGKEREDYLLFNETAGNFIVEVENENTAKQIFKGIPHILVGKTIKDENIIVKKGKETLFDIEVEPFKKAWQEPMQRIFG